MRVTRRALGFTLVELSVVLLVVTLLLGSVLVPLATQARQRNAAETQRILEDTRAALLGYAMMNGRLPRPAASATDGTEAPPCATAGVADEAKCTGFIPWAVLGTPRSDAWGKLIRYSVNSNYAGGISGTSVIPTTQFTLTAGERVVNSRDPSGAAFVLATNVPAVVVSHGYRNLGTSEQGTALPDSPNANADEDANALAGATTFWSRSPADSASGTGGEFDDQVSWISGSQLFSQLVVAGRLP